MPSARGAGAIASVAGLLVVASVLAFALGWISDASLLTALDAVGPDAARRVAARTTDLHDATSRAAATAQAGAAIRRALAPWSRDLALDWRIDEQVVHLRVHVSPAPDQRVPGLGMGPIDRQFEARIEAIR